MTATLGRYRITFASEWLLGQEPGRGYLGCGVSTAFHGGDDATLGEVTTLPSGARMRQAAITSRLRRGWRAFKRVPDENGIPDRDDYVRIHRAIWPGLPDPEEWASPDWGALVDRLDSGYGVSLAVRLTALPTDSPARRYTSADHQIYLQRRIGDTAKVVDPMHPPSARYAGHRVPLSDLRKAAKAISTRGNALAWLYPRGEWTEAAMVRDRLRDVRSARRALEEDLERMTERRDHFRDKADVLEAAVAALKDELDDRRDPEDARAAAWEAAHVASIEWHEDQRAEGPPTVGVT